MRIRFRADSQNNLDYLRYLFKAKPGKDVKVTLSDDFGRMAMALWEPCEKRDNRPADELTVWLRLPRHNAIAGTTDPVHYTDAAQKRLNMILTARFNIELNAYYTQGIAMGIPKQEIIKSFIVSRGLAQIENNTNALTKKTYRNDMAAISKKMEKLIEKARYNHQKIEGPMPPKHKKNISLFSQNYR
jgi:hypothetical protein